MSRLLVALATALVLVATLAVEYHSRSSEDAVLTPTSRRASPTTQPGAAAPAADRHWEWATAVLARPLFSQTRRPPATAAAASPDAADLPRLTGILVTGAVRHAIFAAPVGGHPTVATEGGRLGVYRIQSIEAGKVIVIGPQGAVSLRPSFAMASEKAAADRPGVPAASASAPPAPASDVGKPSILDQLRASASLSIGIPGLSPPSAAEPDGGTAK